MCGRLLDIRAQAMYKSGKKIKSFLDGFWYEHGSRMKWKGDRVRKRVSKMKRLTGTASLSMPC